MIILEGPDGGGKTTLLEELSAHYSSIPVHTRACTSMGGPLPGDELYDWAAKDVSTWAKQGLHFYDRHPFISEYIYGPVIRGSMDPRFITTGLQRRLQHRALIVLCLPPLEAVRASVSAEHDMPGVTTHIDTIWHLYASLRAQLPGVGLVHYDYTQDKPEKVFPPINSHATYWRVTK